MLLQSQRPSIRPLTTAHLAQTMTLMGLTATELRQRIESELADNPALQVTREFNCPSCQRPVSSPGLCSVCRLPQTGVTGEPIVFVSARSDFNPIHNRPVAEGLPKEELTAKGEDLATVVMRQIAADLTEAERPIAAHILTSLDDDGLLPIPIVEIARYHHIPLSVVQHVKRLIQRANPAGVGSSNPQEALLAQLEILSETRTVPDLAAKAIQEGMNLLSRHAYQELGRLLGTSTTEARKITHYISENLNPFPARAFWGDLHLGSDLRTPLYQSPDIVISRLTDAPDTPLVVEVISPFAGRLRINSAFKKALPQAPEGKTDQWKNALEQASLLIKCIQQRNRTIVRLMERLAQLQRQFLLYGDAHLVPITRASLALELEVHESTISRAVSSKAVQLPSGRVIAMSKLFDRSLPIRTILRQIIADEGKPLTDTQLSRLLNERGYKVARRTVAKYRAMEGILPAHMRNALRAAAPSP